MGCLFTHRMPLDVCVSVNIVWSTVMNEQLVAVGSSITITYTTLTLTCRSGSEYSMLYSVLVLSLYHYNSYCTVVPMCLRRTALINTEGRPCKQALECHRFNPLLTAYI